MGTWIETLLNIAAPSAPGVVPLVGTWIETSEMSLCSAMLTPSFPLRERGLKLMVRIWIIWLQSVVPLAGTWIETVYVIADKSGELSFPLRERGLKQRDLYAALPACCRRSP